MSSSVAPLAFDIRAPVHGTQGAFRFGARVPRTVALGRVGTSSRRDLANLSWLPTATAASTTATTADTSSGVSFDLLGLAGGGLDAATAAAAAFERVDDVVMGGVSSSAIGPDGSGRECLVWAGKCRSQGGGFTGARSVALQTPLDLSQYDGLSLKVGFESDSEPERRTWKATVRTQNDRGEMVYQATFLPPVVDKNNGDTPVETRIPWSKFRLVRGPTVVPDVPPLSAEQCASVYGLGFIMSRFGPQGPMPEFREGPFRLAVHAMGVYSSEASEISQPVLLSEAAAGNAGKKASENRGTRNIITFLLTPLIKIAFSEKRRRRKLARALLKKEAGFGIVKSRLFGQKLKTTRKGGNVVGATVEGVSQLFGDMLAATLTLPLRLVFITLSKFARLMRAVKGQKQLPKMK
tara:strand:+ start:7757 stop:8980 length:1224 start_codon:yes stop_codon:yes gene_type:complete